MGVPTQRCAMGVPTHRRNMGVPTHRRHMGVPTQRCAVRSRYVQTPVYEKQSAPLSFVGLFWFLWASFDVYTFHTYENIRVSRYVQTPIYEKHIYDIHLYMKSTKKILQVYECLESIMCDGGIAEKQIVPFSFVDVYFLECIMCDGGMARHLITHVNSSHQVITHETTHHTCLASNSSHQVINMTPHPTCVV